MSSICHTPRPPEEQGWGSAKGSDERPASTYDHGDCVYMTATSRGGIYIGRESYLVAFIVAEVKIARCPGSNVRWEGLPEEANKTEYAANVKRQGKMGGRLGTVQSRQAQSS
jgi:hypothetical protein